MVAGAGANPASAAPWARIRRRRHARLHPSRYHDPLCRPGRGPPARSSPSASRGINQVENWFNIITQKAIRRGSFSSVTQLKEKILRFTDHYNPGAHPFLWTATADSILQKIQRLMSSYLWDATLDGSDGTR